MSIKRLLPVRALVASLALVVAACGGDDDNSSASSGGGGGSSSKGDLSGTIRIDGSSTVFPFAQAAAELFNEDSPNVKITVGESGTGGGFEKFCAGETDISDASRPIDPKDEAPVCKKNGVQYGQVQIANDGIAVATNKGLQIKCMTTDQLNQLWKPKSTVKSYSDIDPSFPDQKVALFGPDTDSGTFDFFTDKINGEEGASREDYEASADDNQLVTGVAGTDGGLGYFGLSYLEQNKDKLNDVQVDGGGGCVTPSTETVQNGSYKPLSRPLFMYPSKKSIAKPEVKAFMDFVMQNADAIAKSAQIVPLTDPQATKAQADLKSAEGAS
jgi:phosphate transport system substrate-binding protein